MNRSLVRAALVVAVCSPLAAGAQSSSDFAAWVSLIRSPHGAFAPQLPLDRAEGVGTSPTLRARYASWSFGPGDDETTNLGIGADFPAGGRTLRVDALLSTVKNCAGCRAIGLNVGVLFPVIESTADAAPGVEISVIPGLGYASWAEGEVGAFTATVEVPLALRVNAGSLRLRPFLTPGFGFARVADDTDSETGSLPSYGYGIAIGGSRWDASLGVRQIVLEDAPDVMGFNFAWRW